MRLLAAPISAGSRWPTGFCCPDCGVVGEPWEMAGGWLRCRACRRETSITAGTIFEGTRKPLRTWFLAMWFVTSQKNGVSALGLQRALGLGSYETSWTWLHKLRRAMVRPGRDRLAGEIEAELTYVGGPEEGKRGRAVESKAIVAVVAEQRGRAASGASAFGASRTSPRREPVGLPARSRFGAGGRQFTPTAGEATPVAAGGRLRPSGHGDQRRLRNWRTRSCHAPTKSPPCSNGGCWGLSRAASSTNISTTTSTNSPSASIGVDITAQRPPVPPPRPAQAVAIRTGPLPLHHHTQDIPPISPNWGNERGYPLWSISWTQCGSLRKYAELCCPGGWFCAWTPNRWGYVGIGARCVPNSLHAMLLPKVHPSSNRQEKDVFLAYYRMNTMAKIRAFFSDAKFVNCSYVANGPPAYNFGSSIVARLILLYGRVIPPALGQHLQCSPAATLGRRKPHRA